MQEGYSDQLDELRAKIDQYLRLDQMAYEVLPDGDYAVRQGSTLVVIQPRMWGDITLVQLVAPVALEIGKISPQLTRFIAEKNNELLFGKFALDVKEKAIYCEHTLLGDFLDPDELLVAVESVVATADYYDEKMAKLARAYLARRPDSERLAFLRLNFAQLQRRHGSVVGIMVPRPKIVPVI